MMTSEKRTALAVINPQAGAVSDELVERVRALCRAQAVEVREMKTEACGAVDQVAAAIAAAPPALVVAVGGDGTVREVVEGVVRGTGGWPSRGNGDRAPALAVVPAGSGNSAYALLWRDAPWEGALSSALHGSAALRATDLIRVRESGDAALLGVNFGLIAHVARVIERMKSRGDERPPEQRYWAAFGEVLQDLRPFPARVTVDGRVLHDGGASMITVGGVRSFGRGMFKLLPRSVIDDGLLDVCVVTVATAEQIAALAALAPAGDHVGEPGVLYAQGATVSVERTDGEPLTMEHDGDPHEAGMAVTLEAVPRAVPFAAAEASATERG